MRHSISHILVLAVAALAIGCAGCDLGARREAAARLRLEKRMEQARLTAARELLAAGYVDQAQRILKPYLPLLEDEAAAETATETATEVQVAQEPAKTAETLQLARLDLETLDKESQVR